MTKGAIRTRRVEGRGGGWGGRERDNQMKRFGRFCCRTWCLTAAVATATRSQSRSSLDSAADIHGVLEGNPRVSRPVRLARNATEPRDRDTTRIKPRAERTSPIRTPFPRIDRSAMDPISRFVHENHLSPLSFFLSFFSFTFSSSSSFSSSPRSVDIAGLLTWLVCSNEVVVEPVWQRFPNCSSSRTMEHASLGGSLLD